MFEVLFALVKHATGGTDEATMDICRARLHSADAGQLACYSELLACDEAMHYIPRDDEEALRKEKQSLEGASASRGAFKAEWQKRMATVRGSKSGNVTKAMKKTALKGVKVGMKEVPRGDFTEAQAKMMLPPDGLLWFEHRDQNWRGRLRQQQRISKGCLLHGYRGGSSTALAGAVAGMVGAEPAR